MLVGWLSTRRRQIAELLRGIELFLDQVLVLGTVPCSLRVVRAFQLVTRGHHIGWVCPNHRVLSELCLVVSRYLVHM
jgi:hypothetical protein